MMQLQQGFATGEMGSGVRGQFGLHDSNSKPLMSALGHSRPSHFVPVLNNVRYASDSDHSRYESEIDAVGQYRK